MKRASSTASLSRGKQLENIEKQLIISLKYQKNCREILFSIKREKFEGN